MLVDGDLQLENIPGGRKAACVENISVCRARGSLEMKKLVVSVLSSYSLTHSSSQKLKWDLSLNPSFSTSSLVDLGR